MQKLMLNTYVQSIITVTIGGMFIIIGEERKHISMPANFQIVEHWLGMNIMII